MQVEVKTKMQKINLKSQK